MSQAEQEADIKLHKRLIQKYNLATARKMNRGVQALTRFHGRCPEEAAKIRTHMAASMNSLKSISGR